MLLHDEASWVCACSFVVERTSAGSGWLWDGLHMWSAHGGFTQRRLQGAACQSLRTKVYIYSYWINLIFMQFLEASGAFYLEKRVHTCYSAK